MRLLITGATGALGKTLIARLVTDQMVERLCVLKHYRQLELPTEGAGFAAFEAWTVAMAARPSAVATAQPADFFINGYRFYAEPPKAA